MDSVGPSAGAASSGRMLSSKQRAPPPPQKVIKSDPGDVEIQEDDIPRTLSTAHRKALIKQSKDQAKEPQALVFRKLDDQEQDQGGASQAKSIKVSLAHSGENLLATFYGMLYTNDGAEREWKLEVDGFIPVGFVRVQGNANKPFRIIAVEKSKRIMEYQVNINTTCARNSTFVKWQDGVSMFGVRFAKEDQAEQFLSTVKRMASTLNQTVLLMKQPERKAMVRKMSDPDASNSIQYTKVSLMIKLPDKQSTIMSVPGLMTMSELFDMICEKEKLSPAEHQLSLPRTGARKVTFDSGTAIGSLKIREVAIIRTMTSDNSAGSIEVEDDSVEDLLDVQGEQSKILQLILPSGAKKSFRVPLDMTMKQLVMRVCSRESLNPRHHSLQYIDFKHEFLEAGSTVDEIGVSQVRLMDKRAEKRSSLTLTKSDDLPTNSPHNRHLRRSCGDEVESDSSGTSEGDKENKLSWQQRSKSLDVLVDEKPTKALSQHDGRITEEDSHTHSALNGSVPTERRNSSETATIKKPVRSNSTEATTTKKPPVPPLPYASKSASLPQNQPAKLTNGGLRDQGLSPIKKNDTISASTPNLSTVSSRSDDSPEMKTSTPESKRRRRAAPPPPPRPAAPKALFTEMKSDAQVDGTELPVKNSNNNLPAVASSSLSQAAAANEVKMKQSQKKRPAPPRPNRPPPPQPAPRVPKQGSLESKDVNGAGREKEISVPLKQDKEGTSFDRAALSLDLDMRPHSDSLEEEFKEDRLSDLRGIPIFIPPPPPDELPPPLDECETPVGPLTDLETDILEGSVSDDFPATVNGYVGMQNMGMYAGRGTSDSQAQSLEAVLEQGYLTNGKEFFPVVPPPPLYSEPETTGLTDIPPPLLEAQTIQTSQEGEEKDQDSGFDQSPEHLIVTPPADPLSDVRVERWEDPDTGSNLDAISAIPPPADFETRPVTPPCQFANPTVAPPVGFNSEDDKNEGEPEKPRKKLNVTEGLFPWMNEPQAPVNAAIMLEVSTGAEDESIAVRENKAGLPPVSEKSCEISVGEDSTETITQPTSTSVVVVPSASVSADVYSGPVEEPTRPELNVQQNVVPGNPEVNTKAAISSKVARVEAEPSVVELQRSSSSDHSKEPVLPQKVDTTVPNETTSEKSKEDEQTRSQEVEGIAVKPVKPEITAQPVAFVKETELKVEPEADVQQYTIQSFTPSTEAVRPKPQVKPAKPDLPDKPEKPESNATPTTVVQETEVKIEQLPPSSSNQPFRSEPRVESVTEEEPDTVTVIKEADVKFDTQQPTPSEVDSPQLQVEAAKPEQRDKPEKPETTFEQIPLVKEVEVKVDASVEPPVHSPFNPLTEPSKLVPQVEAAKPEQREKPEKAETTFKPVPLVKEVEVKVDASVEPPAHSSFNPPTEPANPVPQVEAAKPDLQVKPEEPEANIKPVTFVKEPAVKVDLQQVGPPFNPPEETVRPEPKPTKPEQLVKPEIPEKLNTRPFEDVATPQPKPNSLPSVRMSPEEQQDLPDGSLQKTYNKAGCLTAGNDAPVEDTVITVVNVRKQDIVAEVPVTPETKLISTADDKLKGLEASLQELDKEPVPSSSGVKKVETKPAPDAYKKEKPAVQMNDPFSEEVIVAQTKQVEFSSYEQFGALLMMDIEETPTKEVAQAQHAESQHSQPDSSASTAEVESGLSLDLSALRQSPEPPRPPSSSPPAVSPRTSSLPSPGALDSARSTDSGFSTLEKLKNPSSLDNKPSESSSFSASADNTSTAGVSSEQNQSNPGDTNTTQTSSEPVKPRTAEKPSKLLRPLSMPAGIMREVRSDAVQDSKPTESDLRKRDAVPEKSKTDLPRASTSSESSGIASPSPASSPVTTEEVDMPKPPPFTVPPLRRYSDLAADLSFISSAAKAAEKANEAESKAEVPPKPPPNVLLRRNPGTAAVERPRSWVGPEAETKERPRMWSSAFKPVSFDTQGKKGVRPVDFQVKSFTAPPTAPKPSASSATTAPKPSASSATTAPKPSASSATSVNSTTSVQSTAPVAGMHPDNSLQKEVVKPSNQAPFVSVKPSGTTAGTSTAPAVVLLPRGEEPTSHQSVKPSTKVERTLSNPLTKKTEPGETKYQIIYSGKSDKSSSSQGASNVSSDKTDSGSHKFSMDSASPVALRDQILRDQSKAQSKVTRARPQSAFVGGSKFQILAADEKSQSNTADEKKPATVPPKGPSWKLALKQHTTNQSSKPEVPAPAQPTAKPQPQEKPTAAAAESKPLPAVVMRTKTEQHDPTKRHSLPTYIIEGADHKQPVKTISSKKGNFNFIVEEAQTDTTVVPQGVVAAMKALREKQRAAQGVKEGVLDLEHTQWV